MSIKPISVQLYSLREEAKDDFVGVLKKVADMGYIGVEPAGFHNLTPAEFKKVVDDLGLKVSSSHSPWCNPDNISEVVEVAGILGIDTVTCGYGPDQFATLDAIKETAEMVNGMVEGLKKHDINLMQHNHYWEFDLLDGRLKYDIYAELCPEVKFELDMYWVANFGKVDAPAEIKKFAARTPYLHVKDGPLEAVNANVTTEEGSESPRIEVKPKMAVGKGDMDIPACIAAADDSVLKWLIVELDDCDTDMTEAVADSYRYLVGKGLAQGNKAV